MMKMLLGALSVLLLLLTAGCGTSEEDKRADAEKSAAVKAELEKKARAEHVGQLRAKCEQVTSRSRTALEDTNSRLDAGIQYADYQTRVGDLYSAFNADLKLLEAAIKDGSTTTNCLGKILTPVATAVDLHTSAARVWSDCIQDYYCDIDKGEASKKLQDKWQRAQKVADRVADRLPNLAVDPSE